MMFLTAIAFGCGKGRLCKFFYVMIINGVLEQGIIQVKKKMARRVLRLRISSPVDESGLPNTQNRFFR